MQFFGNAFSRAAIYLWGDQAALAQLKQVPVFWRCDSCKRIGVVGMPPDYHKDASSMSEALNADHEKIAREQYADAQGRVVPICVAQNVSYIAEWELKAILQQLNAWGTRFSG